jgi:uncharacterized protein (TIGR02147 family)
LILPTIKHILSTTIWREKVKIRAFHTQAKNEEERSYFLEAVLKVRTLKKSKVQTTTQDQYEFYSKWYHNAIRSAIGMFPFKDDFQQLGNKLTPPIPAEQVKNSVHLLERLGMIVKGDDEIYRLSDKSVRIGSDISQTAKNNFMQSVLHCQKTRSLLHQLILGM